MFYDEHGVADEYVIHKLKKLREHVDHIYVICNGKLTTTSRLLLESVATTVIARKNEGFDVAAYAQAIENIGWDNLGQIDELILLNYTFYAPIYPFKELFDWAEKEECDFWGITAHGEVTPNPYTNEGYLPFHIQSHFIAIKKRMINSHEFIEYWKNIKIPSSYTDSILYHESQFTEKFHNYGFKHSVYIKNKEYNTKHPVFLCVDKVIESRCPIIKRRTFLHEPSFLYSEIVNVRKAINLIQSKSDYDVNLIYKNITRTTSPRVMYTNLDAAHVFESENSPVPNELQNRINQIKICVLVHLYYVEMLDEILNKLSNMPIQYDLLLTCVDSIKKDQIETKLKRVEFPYHYEIRIMELNRGRDMSSLFITYRDLPDKKYDLALRLHTKKSPQMSGNSAEYFKEYLYENLLGSKMYVAKILNLFINEEHLGIVFPTMVHIGLPTIGHGWFTNRNGVKSWLDKLDVRVPLDKTSPLAPYGTMFWFRPQSLKKLFTHKFEWKDFPKEPNHSDGGLSHLLERMMTYIVHDEGYYAKCVNTINSAEQNYVKLEYVSDKANQESGCAISHINGNFIHYHRQQAFNDGVKYASLNNGTIASSNFYIKIGTKYHFNEICRIAKQNIKSGKIFKKYINSLKKRLAIK